MQIFEATIIAPMSRRDIGRSIDLVYRLCTIAGSLTFLDDIQRDAQRAGIPNAVAARDTPRIFDWLLTAFSYQGISDRVARDYMARHGVATWSRLSKDLAQLPHCHRLRSHWQFDGCLFDKASFTCAEPDIINSCPLPRHRLRNGRLNQTAYSFFLFVRDIADGDLVRWFDQRLAGQAVETFLLQERLIGPLRHVYGVSDKILTMTLSGLLIGACSERQTWFDVGVGMIAIDTLVHNFLHRTGILTDCGKGHAYGAACYGRGGCAEVIRTISQQIDASRFNRTYPRVFPRFVQHAIWQYCAGDGLNICNGNRIDDHHRCNLGDCHLGNKCQKKALKPQSNQ